MNWKWNYGESVLVLPGAALSADATGEQLRVLLWLAGDASLADKPTQLAKLAGCRREDLAGILAFWQESGVMEAVQPEGRSDSLPAAKKKGRGAAPVSATAAGASPQAPGSAAATPGAGEAASAGASGGANVTRLRRADELPTYSSGELADMMEKRESLRLLIDEAQNIFGKMFNLHEVNILVGLVDYLQLDGEYILVLLAHCRRMELKSLRAVERYAISLIDQGIGTAPALEARVQELEAAHTLEGKVRSMFGLKSRALTSKEKKFIAAWIGFGYGEEVIRRAYEITVNATGEPSLSYANAILERWHADGLATPEEIDRRLQAEREAKTGKTTLGNSFDTDDFFEAALKRSFSSEPSAGSAPPAK